MLSIKNIKCAFQAVEEQSVPQWGPEAQSEGQEAEFLPHLMWSVLLDGVSVSVKNIPVHLQPAEVNHDYTSSHKWS